MGQLTKLRSKKDIRDTIRQQRRDLTADQVASLSISIFEHAVRFKPFLRAQTVALYLPIDNEVDTSSLLHHLDVLKKNLCLPVVESDDKRLVFCRYRPGDSLLTGPYGISEPLVKEWVDIKQIDLLFVPLVGFDSQGTRLGYGGGYYDRALSEGIKGGSMPILVGLAFEFQKIGQLPCEAHDIPLHYIVTQSGVRSIMDTSH